MLIHVQHGLSAVCASINKNFLKYIGVEDGGAGGHLPSRLK